MRTRCTIKGCASLHYYNFRWIGQQKCNSLRPDECEYVFVTAQTGFKVSFLRYHDALHFSRVSKRSSHWAQRDCLWDSVHSHVRFRKGFGSARLLWLVMEESSEMWSTLPRHTRTSNILTIRCGTPISRTWLAEYINWWHAEAIPDMMPEKVKA